MRNQQSYMSITNSSGLPTERFLESHFFVTHLGDSMAGDNIMRDSSRYLSKTSLSNLIECPLR